jgi:ASC-1-like (ASCH) protein
VETRAFSSKYKNIKQGDILTFVCGQEIFEKTVSKTIYFETIEKLLDVYEPSDINPELKTKKETIERYYSFPGYKQKIKEFGIIAFEFK